MDTVSNAAGSHDLLIGLVIIALVILGGVLYLRRHPALDAQAKAMMNPQLAAMLSAAQNTLPTRADYEALVARINAGATQLASAVQVDASARTQTIPVDHVVVDPITAATGAAVVKAYIDAATSGTAPASPTITPSDMQLLLATLGGPNIRTDAQRYADFYASKRATT